MNRFLSEYNFRYQSAATAVNSIFLRLADSARALASRLAMG
jgi:hypothetical protein